MSTQTPPSQTNGHDRELSGVHTYRGRKLEDLIPQIRTELGPDAIILRQREGLTGGVGGFFAQKCVEIDAQAAPKPQIDIYDEDPSFDDEAYALELEAIEEPFTPEPIAIDPLATAATEAAASASGEVVGPDELFESFAARLEQAATQVGNVGEIAAAAVPGPEFRSSTKPLAPALPPVSDIPAPALPPVSDIPAPAPAAEAPALEIPAPVSPQPAAPAPALPPAQRVFAARQTGNVEPGEVQAIVAELTAQGISEEWANELVVSASAHRSPLSPHSSLRDAVRATLATTIPAPAPLPSGGAAVAFVGPGGAGKTRCTAALAAAYAHGSSLAASVVSVASSDWGGELKDLLKRENVWVAVAPAAADAQDAVAGGREGGLVVIDTPAVNPADQAAVAGLGADLQRLGVDGIYISVPATYSVRASRKLVDALSALGADGIAVTHADGEDQLGVAAELAYASGMPVAYIHQGLELHGALSAADPSSLAARLLP